ncbi:MAG: efflux RND transporter periplasmic adaptor subunit, partial [Candidatus Paceibacterota bacterium]
PISKKWFIALVAVILLVVVYLAFFSKGDNSVQKITVARGDVSQDVQISGKTKAVSNVDLAFQSGGKIVAVYADVGAKVVKGTVLAVLDQAELSANKDQSSATLASEEARLRELQRGARPEELAIVESALEDAERSYISELERAYASLDGIVRGKIDELFTDGQNASPQFNPFTSDYDVEKNIEKLRIEVEAKLDMLEKRFRIGGVNITATNFESYATDIESALQSTQNLLNAIGGSVNNQKYGTNEADRATLASARASYNTLVATINAAEEKYNTAQKNLDLKQKGSSEEEIAAQLAKVDQARAGVSSIGAKMSSFVIVSPIDGVVTKQDAKVGEMAQAGIIVTSVISAGNLEIEAYIPEVNIGKVSVGNPATITLDALPGESFVGSVLYIDPAETVLDGVVNYKTKVSLESSDERIRSGLTSNLTIHSAEKKAVIVIPRYAVSTVGGASTVKKLSVDTSDVATTAITLGLQGSDGNVEVVSGLVEGDVIVVDGSVQ